ncbi:hypothetical protein MRX96_021435 [Rhipicephalus microplus]
MCDPPPKRWPIDAACSITAHYFRVSILREVAFYVKLNISLLPRFAHLAFVATGICGYVISVSEPEVAGSTAGSAASIRDVPDLEDASLHVDVSACPPGAPSKHSFCVDPELEQLSWY